MRGPDIQQDTLFSTASPESRVPKDHPLRPIRTIVDQALSEVATRMSRRPIERPVYTKEREAAIDMVEALSGTHRVTLGADKNYDTRDCVERLRRANATPHVAQNTSNRSSAIDGRTTRHEGYKVSQRFRKRIEECFGWAKTIGGLRKSRFVGQQKLDFQFVLTMAAYNLVRMRNLGVSACH